MVSFNKTSVRGTILGATLSFFTSCRFLEMFEIKPEPYKAAIDKLNCIDTREDLFSGPVKLLQVNNNIIRE